jgi:phosphate:Na+ symporter
VAVRTSSLHLDLISDLKRIDSHLSIAYPILGSARALAQDAYPPLEDDRGRVPDEAGA